MHSNRLINETSPYLLQHAHNPVDWYPWGNEAFKKAKNENKLVLVSIGYSACHWCHVMEHESFESEEVAALMNEYFVCIKVDREERPDVDKVYMEAVQIISGQGGWPLNCFALSDGRPLWGGTYFPKQQWTEILRTLHKLKVDEPNKLDLQASQITEGISRNDFPEFHVTPNQIHIDELIAAIRIDCDSVFGGFGRAPKFPMPVALKLLHMLGYSYNDAELMDFVYLTLNKMALGGLYDQVGGGFARYSVDEKWFAPHFEKMLYDNAQLLSLYSDAWKTSRNPLYQKVVDDTFEFIKRELSSAEGAFYSALDADSEGEEGKFYTWTYSELVAILGEDKSFFDYFHILKTGNWEENRNILHANITIEEFARANQLDSTNFGKHVQLQLNKLMEKRNGRIRPALDDKQLTSWNALCIVGLTNAYQAFNDQKYLEVAKQAMQFILKKTKENDHKLLRSSKNGASKIDGFLDDYAFTIQALIALYEVTFDENYLKEAYNLTNYTIRHFYVENEGMFFYTSEIGEQLITRKTDTQDNVIPSSVGAMADNLIRLSQLNDNTNFSDIAAQLISKMQKQAMQHPRFYGQWAMLAVFQQEARHEMVICGDQADFFRSLLQKRFLPGVIYAGSRNENLSLPILANRYSKAKTLIYHCRNKQCELPVNHPDLVH